MIDGTFRHHTSDGTTLTPLLKLGLRRTQVLSVDSAIKVKKDVPAGPAALVSCGVTTGYGSAVNVPRSPPATPRGGWLWRSWHRCDPGRQGRRRKEHRRHRPERFKLESAMEFGATHGPVDGGGHGLVGGLTEGVQADSIILTPSVLTGDLSLRRSS